jgi:hypothetical protein
MFGVRQITCRTLEVKTGQKYAQYDNAIRIKFVQAGQRTPRGIVLDYDPWLRIVASGPMAPKPEDPLDTRGDGSKVSRYCSHDPRYVTDFEDKLVASGVPVLMAIGAGRREKCMRCVDRIAETDEGGSHVCGICASAIRNESAHAAGEMNCE